MTTDTDETVCTEDLTREAVNNILDTLEDELKERWDHLIDPEYIEESEYLEEERAVEMYEENTNLEKREEAVNAVLELYYSYRSETNAQRESLLAAATYALIGHMGWVRRVTRDHVAEEYDVSVGVISEYSLDILQHRVLHERREDTEEHIERLIKRYRESDSSGLAGAVE